MSSVDGHAPVERALVYLPPVATLNGGRNATVNDNNITVSGDASLNTTTEYSNITVSIVNETKTISGGVGPISILIQIASEANELVIEVPDCNISETYLLKAKSSS